MSVDLDVDRRTAGYALAAVAVVIAAAVLLRTAFFDLSITVRAALLLAGLVSLFVVHARTGWGIDLLVLASYLAFAAYVLSTFPLGPLLSMMGALAAVIGAFALAYVLHERPLRPTRRRAELVAGATLLVAAALIGVDLQVGAVGYEVTVREETSANPEAGDQVVLVGTATATSDSPFREPVAYPDAYACVYDPDGPRRRPVLQQSSAGALGTESAPPGGSTSTDLVVPLDASEVESMGDEIPVERAASCPESADEPRIVVVVED